MSNNKRIGRILVFFGVGYILNFLIRNGLADIINLFLKERHIPNVSFSLIYLIDISVGIIMTGIGIYMLRKVNDISCYIIQATIQFIEISHQHFLSYSPNKNIVSRY